MLEVYLKICLKDTPVSAYTVHSTGLGLMSLKSVVILSHKIYWQGSIVYTLYCCMQVVSVRYNIPHVFENKNTLYLIYILDATYVYILVIPEIMLESNVKPK